MVTVLIGLARISIPLVGWARAGITWPASMMHSQTLDGSCTQIPDAASGVLERRAGPPNPETVSEPRPGIEECAAPCHPVLSPPAEISSRS